MSGFLCYCFGSRFPKILGRGLDVRSRKLAQLDAKQTRRWHSQVFDPKAMVLAFENMRKTDRKKRGPQIRLLTHSSRDRTRKLRSAELWLMRR
jgi:hypothetical protein